MCSSYFIYDLTAPHIPAARSFLLTDEETRHGFLRSPSWTSPKIGEPQPTAHCCRLCSPGPTGCLLYALRCPAAFDLGMPTPLPWPDSPEMSFGDDPAHHPCLCPAHSVQPCPGTASSQVGLSSQRTSDLCMFNPLCDHP